MCAADSPTRCNDVLVADGDNAKTRRQQAVELLALNVFGTADTGGKLITRRIVAERPDELSAHCDGSGLVGPLVVPGVTSCLGGH